MPNGVLAFLEQTFRILRASRDAPSGAVDRLRVHDKNVLNVLNDSVGLVPTFII